MVPKVSVENKERRAKTEVSATQMRPPLFTPAFLQLWAFGFVTFFSAFQLFPTIPFRIMALGGSKAEAGMFLALYTYACAFAAPVTGTIADHIGRRRMLVAASLLFIVFSILYGIIDSLSLLLAVAIVHGVCWSAILASSAAIMSEVVPTERRTEGLAYWGLTSTAAVAIAPLVGLEVYRFGWRALCFEMAGLSLLMAVAAWRFSYGLSKSEQPFPRLKEIVDWRVTATALSLFLISFSYGGITSYVALLADERAIAPKSLFFTVFAISIIVVRLLTARLGDRYGARVVLYPSLILVPFALVLLAWVPTKAALVVAAAIYGAGFGGCYPAFMAFILQRTDASRRGSTFGSVLWAFDTGIGTGSLMTGMLIDTRGYLFAFTTGAIVSAFSIPMFMLTSRLLRER